MLKRKSTAKSTKKKAMSPFESKLLSRVKAARERLDAVESIEELPPLLTIRRLKSDLVPRSVSGTEIKQIRESLNASQAVFALFIQVPVRTLQEWEQGRADVAGCASRLLAEMIDNPKYWEKRFKQLVATA